MTKYEEPAASRMHFAAVDLVRFVATVAVVLLHAASPILYQISNTSTSIWMTHNVVDAAMRFCVPLFFMTSGFLLLEIPSKVEHPLKEVGRRLLRIGLPLIAWTMLYQLSSAYMNAVQITPKIVSEIFLSAFRGAAVYHLWFLYELAALYLLIPILRIVSAEGTWLSTYFVALWMILALIDSSQKLIGFQNWIGNYIGFGNSGYLVVGYLIRCRYFIPSRFLTLMSLVGYSACTGAIAYLTWRISYSAGIFIETFYVYSNFLVIIQSICVFIVLMKIGQSLQTAAKRVRIAVARFSGVSFGIYFLHVHFLERVNYNVLGAPSKSPIEAIAAIFSTAVYAVALAFVIAWPLSRFKATRWLVS